MVPREVGDPVRLTSAIDMQSMRENVILTIDRIDVSRAIKSDLGMMVVIGR